jgi:hypothetical protein
VKHLQDGSSSLEKKKLLHLKLIEPWPLGYPSCSLVTIPPELSQFPIFLNRRKILKMIAL